jgi:hypothetical protein
MSIVFANGSAAGATSLVAVFSHFSASSFSVKMRALLSIAAVVFAWASLTQAKISPPLTT